jgi:transposase-like protein
VAGVVQRRGFVHAKKIDTLSHDNLIPMIQARVLPESMAFTDEAPVYNVLKNHGYIHKRVHHAKKIYVDGDAHTCTIDGFWGLIKNGIRGVYHSVSDKYLQTYLDEYGFRYNRRDSQQPMFKAFLGRIRKASA